MLSYVVFFIKVVVVLPSGGYGTTYYYVWLWVPFFAQKLEFYVIK